MPDALGAAQTLALAAARDLVMPDVIGERWSLLVVRALLGGRQRFTDRLERLGGITPKLLTARLRQLESAGLIEVDRKAGRREVWYRLSQTGCDLEPALDALTAWGIRHARRAPLPGDVAHPDHLVRGVTIALNDSGASPASPVTWNLQFPQADYTITFDGPAGRLSPARPPRMS